MRNIPLKISHQDMNILNHNGTLEIWSHERVNCEFFIYYRIELNRFSHIIHQRSPRKKAHARGVSGKRR